MLFADYVNDKVDTLGDNTARLLTKQEKLGMVFAYDRSGIKSETQVDKLFAVFIELMQDLSVKDCIFYHKDDNIIKFIEYLKNTRAFGRPAVYPEKVIALFYSQSKLRRMLLELLQEENTAIFKINRKTIECDSTSTILTKIFAEHVGIAAALGQMVVINPTALLYDDFLSYVKDRKRFIDIMSVVNQTHTEKVSPLKKVKELEELLIEFTWIWKIIKQSK
jgi:hypothetical protein